MLFRSFAHWLLLIFGVVVLVILLVTAAAIGLLGQPADALVAWCAAQFDHLYLPNKEPIDMAIAYIGAVGTALGAAWTVHTGWHYAERNLPKRVAEAAIRWKEHTEKQRLASIEGLGHHAIAVPFDPAPGPLARWFGWIHDPTRWTLESEKERAKRYAEDFQMLTSGRVNCRATLITAHLEYGAHLSRRQRGAEALGEFLKALRLNRTDPDALELAGRQAFALKQSGVAQRYFETLAEVCLNEAKIERRLRAMRFQAEVMKGGMPDEQVKARNILKAAIAVLTQPNALDTSTKAREFCLAYGQLADVQMVRNTLHSARSALNQAFTRLNQLDQTLRLDLGKWLNDIDQRLRQAERDRDRDHETNEDQVDD